ncbi:putative bifunctional diguanylate cyclase/phosphodiesterase [Pengzhenrongella sicca]|uniref:GGDEF domain-containing protein n=1 Tax=Pengzhenrongella sicca TaxID=2819238 RepID=A0A8A4ZBK8_9MICO|nr:GGDEF domain-containing protein [Pengzhenrongella sicca]QTE27976.1 GGDEF domain-containing protein [Pengzhenrongella sicca]
MSESSAPRTHGILRPRGGSLGEVERVVAADAVPAGAQPGDALADEARISSILAEFARTMLTDFPIQRIVDQLVQRIVGALPITAAGVTLIEPGVTPHYLAASDAHALRFEQLQSELGEGPCLTSFASGEPTAVPDLARDTRYPSFGPAALAAGMAAVFTFPLRHDAGPLGALDLYRDVPGPLDPQAQAAAQTLADVAAAYILNARAREESARVADGFREQSLHDTLTGLPNRVLLKERLERASARAQRTHGAAAVLFVDLDHFKRVNDSHGHHAGDELLVAVAERLAGLVRPGDTLARVSGDEFVFLCEDLRDTRDADVVIRRIEAAFTRPFELPELSLAVSASVGIAYSGAGERVTDNLVIEADRAMYQAKRLGGATHQVLDLRASRVGLASDQLEADVRAALDTDQLAVAYQPIVRAADGQLKGVEALMRWTHPDRGPISPHAAIAAAERIGAIDSLGGWVLTRSCEDWLGWTTAHPDLALDLSVNVSGRQLMARDYPGTLERVLDSTGMDPQALVLEVTEGILLEESGRIVRTLAAIRDLGVRLALDDFGTGFCSLTYLRRFPIDIVKIDQSFVAEMGTDPASGAIVEAIARLAHVLNLSVTAEGVETEEQRAGVLDVGCDLAQGYLFARPMAAADLAARLERPDGVGAGAYRVASPPR